MKKNLNCNRILLDIYIYRYQFPPLNPLWYICLGLVILILGIIGVCGNFVVVYIFLLTPSMRTPSNLLVINLAFSDCVMMFLECPPMVISCYYQTWVLGKHVFYLQLHLRTLIMCRIWMCFYNILKRHATWWVHNVPFSKISWKQSIGKL